MLFVAGLIFLLVSLYGIAIVIGAKFVKNTSIINHHIAGFAAGNIFAYGIMIAVPSFAFFIGTFFVYFDITLSPHQIEVILFAALFFIAFLFASGSGWVASGVVVFILINGFFFN